LKGFGRIGTALSPRAAVAGGMKATEIKRLKKLELANTRLKGLWANAKLDKAKLKELVAP